VVEELNDGQVTGTLIVSRGAYREGEIVEVSFSLENTSDETVVIEKKSAVVVDLILSNGPVQIHWSDEAEPVYQLILEPAETYLIQWEFSDLTTGSYGIGGVWRSRGARDEIVGASFDYGPTWY
jgi:hypothetical protein